MSKVVSNFNSQPTVNKIVERAKKRLLAIGFQIERDAKLNYTEQGVVDTGRLRASISVNWTGSGLARGKTTTFAGRNKRNEYAALLEKVETSDDGVGQPSAKGERFEVVVGTNVFYACVKANTNVLTNTGWKRISRVKAGDKVLTQTGEYHSVVGTVKIKNVERPDMVTITAGYRTDKNRKLTMTKEHKVLVFRDGRNKWVEAGNLQLTDKIYATPKIPHNKGISKYGELFCEYCKTAIQKNSNYSDSRKYCSTPCKLASWSEGANPHIGMKRPAKSRKRMSISAKRRIIEKPETHANRILAKRGHTTSTEKQLIEWFGNRKIKRKYIRQYQIGKHFVDFYIPSSNTVYEADGAYWHKSQERDIQRDKELLELDPRLKIVHIHFYDKKHSPKDINANPLPNVYYSVCNPGVSSYVDQETFATFEILSIKHWKYVPKTTAKGIRPAYVYDLSVEGVHSYYANGILVSNSFHEFGTSKMGARPCLRPAFEKNKVLLNK